MTPSDIEDKRKKEQKKAIKKFNKKGGIESEK